MSDLADYSKHCEAFPLHSYIVLILLLSKEDNFLNGISNYINDHKAISSNKGHYKLVVAIHI